MFARLLSFAADIAAKKVLGSGKGKDTPSEPSENESPARRQSTLADKLWTASQAWDLAERAWNLADKQFPQFSHSISVSVKGGPEADLRRVWYLCVSAAFGRYRNRSIGVQKAMFRAVWDVTGKTCSCTISYQDSGLLSAATRALDPGDDINSGLLLIQQGPDQVTVGGNWPGFLWTVGQTASATLSGVVGGVLATIPGFGFVPAFINRITTPIAPGTFGRWALLLALGTREPPYSLLGPSGWTKVRDCEQPFEFVSLMQSGWGTVDVLKEMPRAGHGNIALPWRRVYPVAAGSSILFGSNVSNILGVVPVLPDDGRVITTGEKRDARCQPPRPQLDGISRNSLVQLVAQSIQEPCYVPQAPPCQPEVGREGIRLYPAGTGTRDTALNAGQITRHVLATGRFLRAANGSTFSFLFNTAIGPDRYVLPLNNIPLIGR